MIDYSIKNILKRKVRSTLTAIGIAVLIALVIVITGIVSFQKNTMKKHASAGGAGRMIIQSKMSNESYPAKYIDLSETIGDSIVNLKHVQHEISGSVLFYEIAPPPYPNSPPEVLFTGVEKGKEQCFTGNIVNETKTAFGKKTFNGCILQNPVILGVKAKEYFEKRKNAKLTIGDSIQIEERFYKIIGMLNQATDIVVNSSVIVPLDILQKELDKENLVSSVILYLTDISNKESVLREIKKINSKVNIITSETLMKNASEGIKLFEKLINGVSMVVVLSSIILIVTVMLITVKERTKEIGILRAIGAENKLIIKVIFYEILILSVTGSVLGGIVAGFILKFGLLEDLFSIVHIIKFIPLSIIITLIAGIAPALKIIRISPMESLRYE